MIAPVFEEIAKAHDGKLVVAKVNTDENPQWAMRFGAQGILTLLFVENGEVFDRLVGAAPPPLIPKWKHGSLVVCQPHCYQCKMYNLFQFEARSVFGTLRRNIGYQQTTYD